MVVVWASPYSRTHVFWVAIKKKNTGQVITLNLFTNNNFKLEICIGYIMRSVGV